MNLRTVLVTTLLSALAVGSAPAQEPPADGAKAPKRAETAAAAHATPAPAPSVKPEESAPAKAQPAVPTTVVEPTLQLEPTPARKPAPARHRSHHLVPRAKVHAAPDSAKPVATKPTPARPQPKTAASTAQPDRPYLQDYQDPKKDDGEMPLGRVIFDLIWKLAVVLAFAYGCLYVLRGAMGRTGTLPGRKGHLKVLESASLGPNRSVHLVRVGGKVIVVGATSDHITALSEVEDPDLLQELTQDGPSGFSSHLNDAMTAEPKASAPTDAGPKSTAAQVHEGARHLWDRVQEIRGLRGDKGGSSR